LASLGRYRTGWLTGGAHLVILWIAAGTESRAAWPFALAAMAVVSFFAWAANYRRYRQVQDLPTSKIASAAQGYVELYGRSAHIPGNPVSAPCSGLPCCWWSYRIERKTNDNKWIEEDCGESVAHFLLIDETGECVISPDGAEVIYARKSVWTRDVKRYTEWLLLPDGPLYAVGDFRTTGGSDLQLDENRDIGELLAEWKKDSRELLARFDGDESGDIDLKEWEQARLEARREVQQRHAELRATPGLNMLSKPADGRVYILAAGLPATIGRRFAFWSSIHLVFMFVAVAASVMLFRS